MKKIKERVVALLKRLIYKIAGFWIVRHISNNRYIYFTLVCIAIPIIIYWQHFGSNGLSDSTDNWDSFSDYIGGCCSLILALIALVITRKMDKKERRDKKKEDAAEEIYNQIQKIRSNDYDARHVNKLRRDTERNRLYLSEDLYSSLMRLADYFLQVKDGVKEDNPEREEEVILRLKNLYNE